MPTATSARPREKKKEEKKSVTIEMVMAEVITPGTNPDIHLVAQRLYAARRADRLTPEHAAWVDREAVSGLSHAVAARLDSPKIKLPGRAWSTRKFIATLNAQGKHGWTLTTEALVDDRLRLDAVRHCWAVVDGHISGLVQEARLLVDLQEDPAQVREQIMRKVNEAFAA
jgi:hypothetical protein